MIDALIAAVSGANTALDMLKRGVDVRDQRITEKAVADMTENLRAVTSSAFDAVQDALRSAQEARALDKRIVELEKEVSVLRAAAEERDNYHLVPLTPNSFAYTLKAVPEGGSQHYLCQACYDGGKKVVLQRIGGRPNLECSACNAIIASKVLGDEARAAEERVIAASRANSSSWEGF